jgi:L-lysine 2,3-aminomutase
MIPLSPHLCQSPQREITGKSSREMFESRTWQQQLAQAYKNPLELLAVLGLSADDINAGIDPKQPFPQRVPHSYVACMRRRDPLDPLLLQVLPRHAETHIQPDFLQDPVGDSAATVCPGLLHKYHGRVLLITTAVCPIHCRYCFRRHFPYEENRPDDRQWTEAIDYIAAHPDINEVILSGGDPLSLSTVRLRQISDALRQIPHVQRLRIHTRMPIVLPARIDHEFLTWLAELPWQLVIVTHCNHANELSKSTAKALKGLKNSDVTLLNQAVLLKSINDNADTLTQLSEALFSCNVLPYYLHLLDRVQGAAHFEVTQTEALFIMNEVRQKLPGFLVPQLVRENAGEPYKRPLTTPSR